MATSKQASKAVKSSAAAPWPAAVKQSPAAKPAKTPAPAKKPAAPVKAPAKAPAEKPAAPAKAPAKKPTAPVKAPAKKPAAPAKAPAKKPTAPVKAPAKKPVTPAKAAATPAKATKAAVKPVTATPAATPAAKKPAKKPTATPAALPGAAPFSGSGTPADPWQLKTPPGKGDYQVYRDEAATPPALVCQVGSTQLRYDLRCIADLHAMLKQHGDWMPLGGADEQKPAPEGSVEAWGRSASNPVKGWYGLRKGYRGRFGVYLPPVLEALGLAEVEHLPRNNRMRAR